MIRKILFNIISGWLFVPLVDTSRSIFDDFLKGNTDAEDLLWGVESIFDIKYYIVPILIFIVMVLLPFQLIKDWQYRKRRQRSFLWKWLVLSALIFIPVFIMWLSIPYMWKWPAAANLFYVAFCLGVGLIINTFLYFMIDRYVEKRKINF